MLVWPQWQTTELDLDRLNRKGPGATAVDLENHATSACGRGNYSHSPEGSRSDTATGCDRDWMSVPSCIACSRFKSPVGQHLLFWKQREKQVCCSLGSRRSDPDITLLRTKCILHALPRKQQGEIARPQLLVPSSNRVLQHDSQQVSEHTHNVTILFNEMHIVQDEEEPVAKGKRGRVLGQVQRRQAANTLGTRTCTVCCGSETDRSVGLGFLLLSSNFLHFSTQC